MSKKPQKRVLMARKLAAKWVAKQARAEYRFSVLFGQREIRHLSSLLKSMRDGKLAMADVPTIGDLGVSEDFDKVTMWSEDREALIKLAAWFEKRGFETTGVW